MRVIVAALLVIPLGLDLYMPVPEANPLTAEKIELGRRLFNDRRLSRDGSTACVDVPRSGARVSEGAPIAVGVFGRSAAATRRRLINRGYGRAFFWDARVAVARRAGAQADPGSERDGSDARRGVIARRVSTPPTCRSALASYVRASCPAMRLTTDSSTAIAPRSPTSSSRPADVPRQGQLHGLPRRSELHRRATPQHRRRLADDGTAARRLARSRAGRGDFKTPTLREVARTAPYMHDGSLATLEDVVDFYDRGGRANPHLDPELRPLHLTDEEKRSLVAFLRSLAGTVVDGSGAR